MQVVGGQLRNPPVKPAGLHRDERSLHNIDCACEGASVKFATMNYRFIAKTEVVIGRSQPEPRSGEGFDQADHGRLVEAMKVFLATVSQTNGRGPGCTEADQAGIEAPVLSLQLDDPLEEEDEVWDTAMVEAVSTVMNTVEVSNQALVGGPGQKQDSSFGQGV